MRSIIVDALFALFDYWCIVLSEASISIYSEQGTVVKVTVACDICRHRYQANVQRLGSKQKCQYCESTFQLEEAPEVDEEEADPDAVSPFWQVMHRLGQGATGVVVLAILVFMVSLVFTDPRVSTAGFRRSTPPRKSNFVPVPLSRSSNSTAPKVTPQFDHAKHLQDLRSRIEIPDINTTFPPAGDLQVTPAPPPTIPTPSSPNFDPGGSSAVTPMQQRQSPTSSAIHPENPFIVTGEVPSRSSQSKLNYDGPGAISPSGRIVKTSSQVRVGQVVLVRWNTSWFAADVLSVSPDKVKIHYRGWGNNWDEEVPLSRIQLAHEEYENRNR